MSKNKNIKLNKNINTSFERKISISPNVSGYFSLHPSWNFSKCDLQHPKWSLSNSDFLNEILPKLISFEQRTWGDIESSKKQNHWISYESWSKEAQKRYIELKLDYDSLFSLHLTGTLRLFGFIENGVYYIIWYDPNHEICRKRKITRV